MKTVADALNKYHADYVKPELAKKLDADDLADLDTFAPINSPALTGTPTAPTADNDTDDAQLATTEFCQNLIRRLVGAAPETLNTLVELATAINNDPNFAQTIVQALDGKLNKTDAQTTYLSKTDANTTYAKKSEIPSTSDFLSTSGGNVTNWIYFTGTASKRGIQFGANGEYGWVQGTNNNVILAQDSLHCIEIQDDKVKITASGGLWVNGTRVDT